MKTRAYRHFDLPTTHIASERHYRTPRALTPSEIARRRANPGGTTGAESQYNGTAAAAFVVRRVESPEEIRFATKTFGVAAMASGGYNIAQAKANMLDVMRSRLHLSWHGDYYKPSGTELLIEAVDAFDELAVATGGLITKVMKGAEDIDVHRDRVGRRAGEAALALASANLGDTLQEASIAQAQTWKREQGLRLMMDAHALTIELGVPPSLAQLSDPSSRLSEYITESAPATIRHSFHEALGSFAMPR